MKKSKLIAPLICALLALVMSACNSGSSTYTQFFGDAKVEIENLNGSTQGDFELPYFDVAYSVELESGTIDIEVFDAIVSTTEDDFSEPTPLGSIHEATGLASGAQGSFVDDDGTIIVRITSSDGATGTITFEQVQG